MDQFELLEKSLRFCQKAAPENTAALNRLMEAARRETFRVCVVGGFSRGKSHFLNTLLGSQILPESAIPATSMITVILYGDNPELGVVTDGQEQRLPLISDNLARFSAFGDGEADFLKIYCPLPILKNGLELVDTPGVDDAEMSGARLTCEALLNADAAIIMLSAISPLSMTEKEFVQVYLLDRAIPLLACGLSFLDQIPAQERQAQLAYAVRRARSLYPGMAVLVPDALPGEDIITGAAIGQFLEKWQNLPQLAALRQKMILERLGEILRSSISSLAAREKLLNKNLAEAKAALAAAIADLDPDASFTINLKMEFMDHLDTLMDFIRTAIDNYIAGLAANPEGFDEETFYNDFSHLYDELTEHCALYIQKDMQKLEDTLTKRFGTPGDLSAAVKMDFSQFPVTRLPSPKGMPDLFLETAINRGLELGDVIAPHIPMGRVLWPMLKPQIRKAIEELRAVLTGGAKMDPGFQKELSANGARMSKALRMQLEAIYKKLFEEAREATRHWLEEQKRQLAEIHDFTALEKQQQECREMQLEGYALRDEQESLLKTINKAR